VGQALVVVDGPLPFLGGCTVLSGIGQGLCFAHLNSWTIAAARPGEEERTASWIPMAQQLGKSWRQRSFYCSRSVSCGRIRRSGPHWVPGHWGLSDSKTAHGARRG